MSRRAEISAGPARRITLPENLKIPNSTAPTYPVGAVVMVAGAGGGLHGPAAMYPDLAKRLTAYPNIITVQCDYRFPGDLMPCIEDTIETLDILRRDYNCERAVIVGWSFGGAVVISAAARHSMVNGIATVASQTAGTDSIGKLGGQGVASLFIHGTGDSCLPARCSEQLYRLASDPKELVLYPADNHGVTNNKEPAMGKIEKFVVNLLTKPGNAST
ncbi:uncharacterized protein YfhR-like [Paramacrobiotus metropolitanus]|uniref:uncharacterized protein YfhR-like n=1 Tax=Paramacrobiotus metropolitanus TaxID=2943436 RepID=UPI002445B70C|nr:uncharacterized protein YfhR-like [Paramacrobiotus metropolitanus]